MPDLDIIERRLRRAWRTPYRLMKGGHPPEVVADSLIKAAAATLREDGGMPGFEVFLETCMQAHAPADPVRTLAEVSRSIEQSFGQGYEAKLLARGAQRSKAQFDAGRALPSPLHLVQETLRALLRHSFFAKLNWQLVGKRKRFANIQKAREFEASVWSCTEPQITKLANRLLADPTASKLRAPQSLRRRRSTAELLDVPVRALCSPTPWEDLTIEYPEILEVRDVAANWFGTSVKSEIQQSLVTLYQKYCREWYQFPAQPTGWNFSVPQLRLSA